jgi:hypothetical protein
LPYFMRPELAGDRVLVFGLGDEFPARDRSNN